MFAGHIEARIAGIHGAHAKPPQVLCAVGQGRKFARRVACKGKKIVRAGHAHLALLEERLQAFLNRLLREKTDLIMEGIRSLKASAA